MGESIVSRRGGGGSSLAIYAGASLPSEKPFGIFANIGTSAVNKIYLRRNINSAGTWKTDYNSAPKSILGEGPAYLDGVIYALAEDGTMLKYSVSSNAWSNGTAKFSSSDYSSYSLQAYGGSIYLFGGANYDEGWSYPLLIYQYSPESDTYTKKVAWSSVGCAGLACYGTAVYGENVFAWGAGPPSNRINIIRYNPATNTYAQYYTPANSFSVGTTATAIGQYLYCALNSSSSSYYGGYKKFDLTSGTLIATGTIPAERVTSSNAMVFSINGNIFYAPQNTSSMYVSDTTMKDFAVTTSKPGAVSIRGAVTVGGKCYFTRYGNNKTLASYTLAGDNYPAGSIVVNEGLQNQLATILSDKKQEINVDVEGIYWSDGTTLTRIKGAIRKLGGVWVNL